MHSDNSRDPEGKIFTIKSFLSLFDAEFPLFLIKSQSFSKKAGLHSLAAEELNVEIHDKEGTRDFWNGILFSSWVWISWGEGVAKNGSPEIFQQLLQWDSLSVRHQAENPCSLNVA